MKKLKVSIFLSLLLLNKISFSQDAAIVINYIKTYKDLAISEMQRTGIPASIKLAQGIHETSAGTSVLVQKSNNHFGLKCKTEWKGMTVSHTDDAPNECFRKYQASAESYKDQSDYLKNSPRYAQLFTLDPMDYKGWAYGLKKAGYATNPKYSQVLIKLIEEYHLQDYTLIALGKMKPQDEILTKNEKQKEIKSSEIVLSENKPVVQPQQVQVTEIKPDPKPVYPSGEFKVNETKVIYVLKETSYLSIAEKYNIPLARIFEFNELKEQESADRDQLVYIMRKRKTGLNAQHVVKQGETLNDIAQTEALRLESLLEYNFLKSGMKPAVGSVLYLQAKAPSMPALASGN